MGTTIQPVRRFFLMDIRNAPAAIGAVLTGNFHPSDTGARW